MPLPDEDAELMPRIESLFQAAGRLELSRPERAVMLGHSRRLRLYPLTAVSRGMISGRYVPPQMCRWMIIGRRSTYEEEPIPAPRGIADVQRPRSSRTVTPGSWLRSIRSRS